MKLRNLVLMAAVLMLSAVPAFGSHKNHYKHHGKYHGHHVHHSSHSHRKVG